jgi:hypothetical protein
MTTHGLSVKHKKEYTSWLCMKSRCYNSNEVGYKHYGGRGIKVCERWRTSFPAFFEDMGIRPDNHSLDRINPDGDYEPSNCRWSGRIVQRTNQKRVELIEYKGERKTIAEWSRCLNMDQGKLWERHHKHHLSPDEVFNSPENRIAKLTEKSVLEIRNLYANGATLKALSILYETSPDNVSLVVKRKTWKHI